MRHEVMNTVGKSGKLGEHVKCVVGVSTLTEGWDANTVQNARKCSRFDVAHSSRLRTLWVPKV